MNINNWYNTLTIDNIEEVSNMIEEKLKEKQYTFVACNEFLDYRPEIRTGQQMKSIDYWIEENNNPPLYAGFNVNDSYGVWGLSTSQKENKYDHEFNSPYVVFDYNQIKMTLRAPAGHKIYWVVALENE